MITINLNGTWQMRRVGDNEWISGEVPGSVFNDLLTAGKLLDPYYRDNEELVGKYAEYDYEYRRNFTAGEELLACDQVILDCEGLDTLAGIKMNGETVADTKNMHRHYQFDLKSLIKPGGNQISIVFRSALNYITARQTENPLWGPDDTIGGFPHLRKAHFMFGWDWGPKLPDAGIWRNISIRGYQSGRLDDVYITQHHRQERVLLEIRAQKSVWTRNKLLTEVKITTPRGEQFIESISSSNAEDRLWIKINNPELWWPNGYGGQPLYGVEVALKDENDSLLDRKKFRIGLRTFRVKREKDQWGESFAFEINGYSLFAMGANYIPEDSLISRRSPERTEKLIQDCVAANFNCLRVWGGGFYPDDYFYDLCDRYGLIVWQDLMFACAVYELTEEFAAEIVKEAEDNVKRLRHHPSLGLWCGNNEIEVAWASWNFPKIEKLKDDYHRQFEVLLAEVLRETDPNSFYWPSSPSSGGGFDDPNGENRGDVHCWSVWHGFKPFEEYQKYYFRFVSEFGFQSFPPYRTIAGFTLPGDRNIFSYVMEKHQKNKTGNAKILAYLAENYRYPADFKSLLYTSQILQAQAIKTGVEHWRRNRGRCMGALYWQLNDCWPVASWSSIDSHGRWKALHYAAKRFFAPVLLSAAVEGKKVDLYVTNDSPAPVEATVIWRLRDHRRAILREGKGEADIGRLTSVKCLTVDLETIIETFDPQKCYLEYQLHREGETVSAGTVLFCKPKHFEFLNPEITFSIVETEDQYLIMIKTRAFAGWVGLEIDETDGLFSDNYFDLSAGEEKEVRLPKSTLSERLSVDDLKQRLIIRSVYDLYEH